MTAALSREKVDEAIFIPPRDASNLRNVGRVLQRGSAKLVGPRGC